MFDLTPDEIRAYWEGEGANVDRRGRCPHPNHKDASNPNFQVDLTTGCATCYSQCGKTWRIVEWEMEVHGGTVAEAWSAIYRKIGRTPPAPAWPFAFAPPKNLLSAAVRYLGERIRKAEVRHKARATMLYQYSGTDPSGQARICAKVRFHDHNNKKTFQWWALTDRGGWSTPTRQKISFSLYRSEEWPSAEEVHLLNGEKAVDRAVEEWGLSTATCLPNGEGKWRDEYLAAFAGVKRVFVVSDNDQVGCEGARVVAGSLLIAGIEVRIVVLSGLPPKGDLFDFIDAGGTLDGYLDIAHATPVVDPASIASPRPVASTSSPTGAGSQGHVASSQDGIASGFRLEKDALYFDPEEGDPVYVSGKLEILACSSNINGENWSRLARWYDLQGREQNMLIPMELVVGDPPAYRRMLANRGLSIATGRKGQELLSRYIQFTTPKKFVQLTNYVGWHESAYVLPGYAIRAVGAAEVLYDDHGAEHYYRTAGTLEEWRNNVSAKCRGNSRLIFAVSAAFAAPLLRPLGIESGGVHFVASSSLGKTTTLVVAGSAVGGGNRNRRGFLETWRGTSNGFESTADLHNDNLLPLDEIQQVEPREVDQIVYMLANGMGKRRMQRNITARPSLMWRLIFLSSGETRLAEHAATGGKRITAGADVRLLNIPADAGAGYGLFEDLHGAPSARAFADELMEASTVYHGHAQREFLRLLVSDYQKLVGEARAIMNDFAADMLPDGASPEVGRALKRVALFVAAGELATQLGITGWAPGEASDAGRRCFTAWLRERGGSGSFDLEAAIRQVRIFIELNGASRFQPVSPRFDRHQDEIPEKVISRAGFWRQNGEDREYLIFSDIFRSEVCAGYDHRLVAAELAKRGYLQPGNEADHPNMKQERVPGFANPVRFYLVLATVLGADQTTAKGHA
jgi:uncharacterized protein (DUF927 family)